ncbi:hypothetical protein [Maridesulfovibrio sp.]|uniref:hypothetical protein n=1 Tax=Maridesulfovibrio sp. TaxID=2795000 RepID=UPI0039EF7216
MCDERMEKSYVPPQPSQDAYYDEEDPVDYDDFGPTDSLESEDNLYDEDND